MERFSDNAIEIINDMHTERLAYSSEYMPLIDAAQALSDYEDTGMRPEEVRIMREEVHRLREKLARYEQAEKDGQLVKLPCEVGRTVYTLFCGKVVEKRIGQLNVNGYTNPRIWVDIDCDWATTQSVRWDLAIGKTIFLTREEAEAALEKSKTQ